MTFVIWNTTQSKFVGQTGAHETFTACLQNAQKFNSVGHAQKNCFGNEIVKKFSDYDY